MPRPRGGGRRAPAATAAPRRRRPGRAGGERARATPAPCGHGPGRRDGRSGSTAPPPADDHRAARSTCTRSREATWRPARIRAAATRPRPRDSASPEARCSRSSRLHQLGIRRACWERNPTAKPTVNVSVSLTVGPDGSAQSVSTPRRRALRRQVHRERRPRLALPRDGLLAENGLLVQVRASIGDARSSAGAHAGSAPVSAGEFERLAATSKEGYRFRAAHPYVAPRKAAGGGFPMNENRRVTSLVARCPWAPSRSASSMAVACGGSSNCAADHRANRQRPPWVSATPPGYPPRLPAQPGYPQQQARRPGYPQQQPAPAIRSSRRVPARRPSPGTRAARPQPAPTARADRAARAHRSEQPARDPQRPAGSARRHDGEPRRARAAT